MRNILSINLFMSEKQKSSISYFNANFTLTISVALVLLLFGIVAIIGFAGANLSRHVKENIGFDIVIRDTATEHQVNQLKQYLNRAQFVASVKYISKENALAIWEKETGENLMETIKMNPLSAEFEVRVKPDFASLDSINKIIVDIEKGPAVESIEIPRDLIEKVNENVRNITLVLSTVGLLLTLISIALINNTVRLSVYSKRFLIHTMKLVGATSGFIRRPFIVANMLNGLIAGILADAILILSIYYGYSTYSLEAAINWGEIYIILAGVPVLGIILCGLATYFATNKYLNLNYDALFKR